MNNIIADILTMLVVCSFLIIIIIRKNSKINELKFALEMKRTECNNLRQAKSTKNKNTTLYKIKILYGDAYKRYETYNDVKNMHFNYGNNTLTLEGLNKTKYIKMDTIVSIDKEDQNG